jgi:hypothetical protein
VQVVAVHARHAVREHDHAIVEVERGERGVQHAGVGVDAHEQQVPDLQGVQQLPQIGPVEAIQALLVVDDVVAVAVELGHDLGAGGALEVVLAHRAPAPGRQAVGLGLRRVQRLPEGIGHPLAADVLQLAVDEDHVDDGHLDFSGEIQNLPGFRDHPLRVLGLGRHGRDLHVEVAAMHVDGDDRRLARLERELLVEPGEQARAVDDRDFAHLVPVSARSRPAA